jgi:hypothetical protein
MITIKATYNYKDLVTITNALKGLRSFVSEYVYARDASVIRRAKANAIDYIYSKVKRREGNLGDALTIDSNRGMGGSRYDVYFDEKMAPHADTHIGRQGSYATIVARGKPMLFNVKESYGGNYKASKSSSLRKRKIKAADDEGIRRAKMVRVKRSISWAKLSGMIENDMADGLISLANKGINKFLRQNG